MKHYSKAFLPIIAIALTNYFKPTYPYLLLHDRKRIAYTDPNHSNLPGLTQSKRSPDAAAFDYDMPENKRQNALYKRERLYNAAQANKISGEYAKAIATFEEFLKTVVPAANHNAGYKDYDTIIANLYGRIAIIDCHYLNKNLIISYKQLLTMQKNLWMQHLDNKWNSIIFNEINVRIEVYSFEIKKLASSKASKASRCYQSDLPKAREYLTEVMELYKLIHEQVPERYLELQNKVKWLEMRTGIIFCAHLLLKYDIEPIVINEWVDGLQNIIKTFKKYSEIINCDDTNLYTNLQAKLAKALNVQRMEIVGKELDKYRTELNKGNLIAALKSLIIMSKLESEITNFKDISISEVEFITPEQFLKATDAIELAAQDYVAQAKQRIPEEIDKILVIGLRNLGIGAEIYEMQLQDLRENLTKILMDNWYKFYRAGQCPADLIDAISKMIEKNLYPTNIITRTWYWTNDDLFIQEHERLIADIAALVSKQPVATSKIKPNLIL